MGSSKSSSSKPAEKAGNASGKSGKNASKSVKGSDPSAVYPVHPFVDKHPGSHDTESLQNKTLNEDGSIKLGHSLPKITSEQASAKGADKVISGMHKKRGRSQWGNK